LVSGETGVVGNGKAAANDASFDGTKGPHGTMVAEEVSGIRRLGDPDAGQLNIDRIRPVNGRSPINSQKENRGQTTISAPMYIGGLTPISALSLKLPAVRSLEKSKSYRNYKITLCSTLIVRRSYFLL
jgi:hypothetical protein